MMNLAKFSCHRFVSSRTTVRFDSSLTSSTTVDKYEQDLCSLKQKATSLTCALYRTCIRSIRLIRHGNALDEADFQRREQERFDTTFDKAHHHMLSMLPPVDRVDELRSRAEYYLQYARENFVQESDCLQGVWHDQRMARYIYNWNRGEHQRQWLLKDMGFPDPHVNRHKAQMEQLERDAQLFAEQYNDKKLTTSNSPGADSDDTNDDAYAWSDDDEDEEERLLPGWYKNGKSDGGL